MWYIPFLLGIYMSALGYGFAGDPREFSAYPGWSILHFLVPFNYPDFKFWYRFWGTTLAVTSVSQIVPCKRAREGIVAQFLGRVSYGLCFFHGPLLWNIGVRVYACRCL